MNKRALADSGFWFGLLDTKDNYHESALEFYELLSMEGVSIHTPWPVLYEALKTSLVQNFHSAEQKYYAVLMSKTLHVDDQPYRQKLEDLMTTPLQMASDRTSLVDAALNQMLLDPEIRYHYFITNNERDFALALDANPGIERVILKQA